jgi:subtilisin family serine protease/PKD repeat protein
VVLALFSLAFILDDSDTYLTGYVVMEEGVRVSTEKLDASLIEEINNGNSKPKVIVILENTDNIEELQEEVIRELEKDLTVLEEDEKTEIATKNGFASAEEIAEEINILPDAEEILEEQNADLEITQTFESVNAIAMTVNAPEGLLQLTKNNNVKQILLDYPVELSLDKSAFTVNADDVWDISLNGTLLRGDGETVCVIDTGVDYTHDALGGCNPVKYGLDGEITELLLKIESEHPYANSVDTTWTITHEGYSNIAVHFENISLESLSGGDNLDRIYVYDGDNNTLAIYKESLVDVWSPYAQGDTLYVRLVTDGSVTDDGFYIDQVINGTTNTTMDWSSCSKVIGGFDTYNNDADPQDDHKHGTHVAGIIASTNETYQGIAPDAKIVAIKALSSAGSGYSSDIIAGIDWCNSNAARLNISAISMSLGCAGSGCDHYQTFCTDDLMAGSINDSHDAGVAVISAAGNGGWTDGITNPACNQFVIPVGGVNGNNKMTYNRGDLLDLVAPGTSITSSVLSNKWKSLSGTSMATPHVSGAYVVLKQYWKALYGETPTIEQLEARLDATGVKIDDSDNSGSTFSLIDLLASIQPQLTVTKAQAEDEVNVTVDADVSLSNATLEWTYPNGIIANSTMTETNSTQFTFGMSGLAIGTHSYTVYGDNAFSITGTSTTVEVTVTGPTPEISVSSPLPASHHNIDVDVTATLNGTSLTNATYTLYNQSGSSIQTWKNHSLGSVEEYNISVTLTNLTDQNYTFEITVADATESTASMNTTFVVDTISPELRGVTNNPVDVYNNASVTFFINTSDLHMDSVLFETDFTGNMTNHSTELQDDGLYNVTFDVTTVDVETNVTFTVYVVDEAGNTVNSNVSTVTVQLVTTNITSHANESTVELAEVVTFGGTSPLTGNLTYLWTFGDGTNSTNASPQKQYNITGNYTVTFTVTSGNVSETSTITIIVADTTAPTLTEVDYSAELHIQRDGDTLEITGDFFDLSSIAEGSTLVFTNESSLGVCGDNTSSCLWNLTSLEIGNYNFTLNVTDNSTAANVNSSIYGFEVTSCNDGVQNGNEGGVDCDGSCDVCAADEEEAPADEEEAPADDPDSAPAAGGGGGGAGGGGADASNNVALNNGADNGAPIFLEDDAPVVEGEAAEDEEIPAPVVVEEGVEGEAAGVIGGFLTGAFTTVIPEDWDIAWAYSWLPESFGKTEIIIIAGSFVVLAALLVGLISYRRRRKRTLLTPQTVEVEEAATKEKNGNKENKGS